MSEEPLIRRLRQATQMGLVVLCLTCSQGCQVSRSWFQMDSNSSTPFFGFDLMPRRTALLTPPEVGNQSRSPVLETQSFRQVSATNRQSFADRVREIPLPRPAVLLSSEVEESLEFPEPITLSRE